MQYFCGFIIIFCCYFLSVSCFLEIRGNLKPDLDENDGDRGNPLILTPYIKQRKLKEAREAAEVKFSEFRNITSYSGYLTVDESYNSNLFFWFFPSQTDYENAPVILWLQGGPGGSSMFGLFAENGPFRVNQDGSMDLRNHSWTEDHSVIYIDNPVGTGFSFTDGGYAQNQTIVGEALYTALLQFFQLFPELQRNDFFVFGESYGGKYVPAVSYTIHKNNPLAEQKINLKGIGIGDGWVDPEHQRGYPDYLYQIGLIDSHAKFTMHKLELSIVDHLRKKKWLEAKRGQDILLGYIQHCAGQISIYNYVTAHSVDDQLENYLQRSDVKSALHVGNISFRVLSNTVYKNLEEDFMQSLSPWVSTLLSHYRTLIYNGQLDIIVAYPLTVNFLRHLKFSAAEQYKVAERHKWRVDDDVAGYVKQAGNLTEVLVRNAGHMVPGDQPLWAHDLISKFTRNKSLH